MVLKSEWVKSKLFFFLFIWIPHSLRMGVRKEYFVLSEARWH